jgi:hypothetical protein
LAALKVSNRASEFQHDTCGVKNVQPPIAVVLMPAGRRAPEVVKILRMSDMAGAVLYARHIQNR